MKSEKEKLIEKAYLMIEQSDLNLNEKQNLRNNIAYLFSCLSKDDYVKRCTWKWFDEGEDGHGLDLAWDWKDVKGVFGFYSDNGHSFSFEFGESGKDCLFGGEEGEYGFSCGIFIVDFECTLKSMGY